jgi:diguanylate cyclase (GGDEF)-like protein/PAS domain S-box-containing protein
MSDRQMLVEHVLPHLAQVFGGLVFIIVVQRRLEIQLVPKDVAHRLQDLEARFEAAFRRTTGGLAMIGLTGPGRGCFVQANPALGEILGCPAEELAGAPYRQFMEPEDRDRDAPLLEEVLAGRHEELNLEHRLRRADGELVWVELSASVVRDRDGAPAFAVAALRDVTSDRHHDEQLRHLADHDHLTGAFSRRRFEQELERAVAHVARYGEPAALVVIDVDRFKYINDTYGHAAGDQVLAKVASVLRSRIRQTDVLGRLGGDEFGILCPHTTQDGAATLATGLLEAIRAEARLTVEGRPLRLTTSIGVKCLDGAHPLPADQVNVQADNALYEAKENGRDRSCLIPAGAAGTAGMRARWTWSERIRDALEHGGMQLWEQPILNVASGVCDRSELLIRMTAEDGAPIPPGEFLDTAERFGQIHDIDAWVLTSAVELLALRQSRGDTGILEVNLSGVSITDEPLMSLLTARIEESGIDPTRLTFEITETAAVGNFELARTFATRLADLGCRLALDDFGSGFGSFYYLKHLPFDCVKIDGDFIRNLPTSRPDLLTVQAIVQISRGLGKDVTAEFVEDGRTLRMLGELGVDYAQGYHIGRPSPVPELDLRDPVPA